MASSVPVLLLFVGLFTTIVGHDVCAKRESCELGQFCCGTCNKKYCCSDLQKKLTWNAQFDCILKGFNEISNPPRRDTKAADIIGAVAPFFVISIIVLITCWVCPCCCLHKRFRSPRPGIETATVVAVPSYQPLPNNPPYGGQPMPIGPFKGQPYQEAAGPGYSVPFSQAAYGGQDMYSIQPAPPLLPTDYTSPQPAYNPAYVNYPHTTLATPVQSVKTSY